MDLRNPSYSQIKELEKTEIDKIPVVGFPRLLKINTDNISSPIKIEYEERFKNLQNQGLLVKSSSTLKLAKKGKRFIGNIYLSLMDGDEMRNIESQLKILRMN